MAGKIAVRKGEDKTFHCFVLSCFCKEQGMVWAIDDRAIQVH